MKRLLAKTALGHFREHPWQAVLSVVGVALGVAIFVAIEGANGSALRAFRLSAETITGRTSHQIVGGSAGVPQSFYRYLRTELGLRASAPVVEGFARVPVPGGDGRQYRLLGVDPFAEGAFRDQLGPEQGAEIDLAEFLSGKGVALSDAAAADLGLDAGDELTIRAAGTTRSLVLAGVFEPRNSFERQASNDLLIVDISVAQELFRMGDRISRIDLVVEDQSSELDRIAAMLPSGTRIIRPERRSEAAEQMTRAFRLNLRALSLLALLCGAFLIYNTMTFAVVQRRPTLGILRALGVTARELFALVVLEAGLVGVIGSALGIVLGSVLARFLVGAVTQTINDLYFSLAVRQTAVGPEVLAAGAALGIGVAVVAAMGPASEALRTRPRLTLDRAELEGSAHRLVPKVSALGLALVGIGAGCLWLPLPGLVASFTGLFAVLLGLACLTPIATLALTGLLAPLAGSLFGNLGRLSARGVVATLSRTGIAIAALMMAVAVTIGVDVMITSFRDTVDRWLAYSLPADLYVTSPAALGDRFAAAPASLGREDLDRLAAVPGVDHVNTVRSVRVDSGVGPIRLLAHDLDARGRTAIRFQAGDAEAAWEAYEEGTAVLVSEPFAHRHGLAVGSSLELASPRGPRGFTVAGIFFDYATEEGTVMLAAPVYRQLWGDARATAAAIYVEARDEATLEAVRSAALAAFGADRGFVIRSNRVLRNQSLEVFDRTFVVTGVLRLLAILVAFVGVLAALTALQLERSRELGVLRALGITPGEVWTMVTAQTGVMGLVAGVLAIPVGLVMALIMIHVINKRSFGWSLDLSLGPEPLLAAVALAVLAALLAGVYPAFRMARTLPAEALRSE